MDFKQNSLVGNGLDFRVLKSLHGLLTSRYRRRKQEMTPMLELRPASDLGVSQIGTAWEKSPSFGSRYSPYWPSLSWLVEPSFGSIGWSPLEPVSLCLSPAPGSSGHWALGLDLWSGACCCCPAGADDLLTNKRIQQTRRRVRLTSSERDFGAS